MLVEYLFMLDIMLKHWKHCGQEHIKSLAHGASSLEEEMDNQIISQINVEF